MQSPSLLGGGSLGDGGAQLQAREFLTMACSVDRGKRMTLLCEVILLAMTIDGQTSLPLLNRSQLSAPQFWPGRGH
jgi:hypothetical protein